VRGPVAGALACRNRLRACVAAGVTPRFEMFDGDEAAAVRHVVSLNLKRRHLNESQRAMVAAGLAKLRPGANQHAPSEVAQICATSSVPVVTQREAADLLNVSRRAVQSARAVERGKLAVSAAAIARWLSFRCRPKRPVCRLSDTRRPSI
jgi:hypothetical protein